jgi:hypothetical protein
MATKIDVEKLSEEEFQVRLSDGTNQTSHRVTLKRSVYEKLTGGEAEPAELVKRSFEFLLEHESKESILRQFKLEEIGRYFPQFESEIKIRVGAPKRRVIRESASQ